MMPGVPQGRFGEESTSREERKAIKKEVAETRYFNYIKAETHRDTFADLSKNEWLWPDSPASRDRCNSFLVSDGLHP